MGNSITYKKIYGYNFSSFEKFELPIQPGKHLIIGENKSSGSSNSNGSGKSSLFESIPWTQYKRTNRGKDVSRDYKGNCKTGVVFVKDGDEYKLERHWKNDKHGNSIQIFKNGEEVSHRKATTNETEIEQLLGISYDIFVTSCVVLQKLPINFTALTPTVRKTIVEEMVGFSVWDDFRKKFSGYLYELNMEKSQKDSSFLEKKNKMVDLNARLETIKSVESGIQEDLSSEISDLKLQFKKSLNDFDNLKNSKNEILSEVGNGISQEISTMQSSITLMRNKISNLESILSQGVCPQCKQDYPNSLMGEADLELSKFRKKVEIVQTKLKKLEEKRTVIQNLDREMFQVQTDQDMVKSRLMDISSKMNKPDKKEEIETYQEQVDSLLVEVNYLMEELKELESNSQNLKYLDQLMLPSSKFRTFVLEKYMGYLNSIIESVTPLIFQDVEFGIEINSKGTGIELKIKRNKKSIEYKSLSGGEQRRLDIVTILAFQRFMIESSGVTTNLLVFDEIFDGLDATGIENVLSCMDTLFPESSSVYVITHNDNIKSMFSSVIKVVKEDNVSYVEGGEINAE